MTIDNLGNRTAVKLQRLSAVFAMIFLAFLVLSSHQAKAAVFIRLNQAGYLPNTNKVALVMTNDDLAGASFQVQNQSGSTIYSGKIGPDRGRYGGYSHVYEIDFSALTTPGSYRLHIGGDQSPLFNVNSDVYRQVIPISLKFLKVQRCGDTDPLYHGPCHLNPSLVVGGPHDGETIDVSGGWHDAGDYIQFLGEVAASLDFMLLAYLENESAFEDHDNNEIPDLLDEASIGLAWLEKMWDSRTETLYYQVSDDEHDHDEWRLPEEDDIDPDRPPRPVYACEPGKGANYAGRAAAAFALASTIWNDSGASFYDPARAVRYFSTAEQLYSFGLSHRGVQHQTFNNSEHTWRDDMLLASAELYRVTADPRYVLHALYFGGHLKSAWSFNSFNMHAMAYYVWGKLVPWFRPFSTKRMQAELDSFLNNSQHNVFRESLDVLQWGSATEMSARALEALWYEELGGSDRYRQMAQDQWDYLFGLNPWGVSFINGMGSVWPHDPHHQIADILGIELLGFWDEGPMPQKEWSSLGIQLSAPDEYAAFQSSWSVYHDDVEDYATNEPTIIANAVGIALCAWINH